ncbi:MAG: SPFH/Band 7/PHB domain protein [Candidatus Zixiibacteriota bacterium]|nr:MAG: SPFH/Band 7/PHB domain protein [candidate division Zixibacteria bacterium]
MDIKLIIVLGFFVVVVAVTLTGIKQVPQGIAVLIERLGKYHRTLGPGISFILPFFDKRRYVKQVNNKPEGIKDHEIDLREQVYDIPQQTVITKDNINLTVDTLLFYQIVEPYRACYEIKDLVMAIRELSKTAIRNIFGEMDMDESLSARESINDKLRTVLDEATDKWGTKVNRVEIQNIIPPADLKDDMEKQMKAERAKRQDITIAEGKKQSAILEAEGLKQNQILRAQGESEAKILRAEAEKKEKILVAEGEAAEIKLVQEAKASGWEEVRKVYSASSGVDSLLMLEILKSQSDIAEAIAKGDNQKIYLPTDMAGLFGAIGGIKELLNTRKEIGDKISS